MTRRLGLPRALLVAALAGTLLAACGSSGAKSPQDTNPTHGSVTTATSPGTSTPSATSSTTEKAGRPPASTVPYTTVSPQP